MTPLETIKTGILNNDMEEVIQGFMELTGEEVRPETSEDEVREVPEPTSVSMQKLDFSTEPTKSAGEGRLAHKTAVKADGENQFVDDGLESKGVDFETPDISLAPRRRPETKTVKVACHVCDKSYDVIPMLAQGEFYRCDNCVGKK